MNEPNPPQATQTERSRVSRKWALKIGVIAVALIAFGFFGVYDAIVGYPARGRSAAEYAEYQYLQQLATDHLEFRASIQDPAAALADLYKKEHAGTLPAAERLEKDWLEQLSYVGKLEPGSSSTQVPRTDFRGDHVADYSQRFLELKKRWTTSAGSPVSASPLSTYDIPMQWLIAAVGVGCGGWLVILMMRTKAKVFRWDRVEQRLTLPNGISFVPQDIEEFDKRKWHRLYIDLKMKPSHPQLGGKSVELDLLRHEPVEEWVLAMERTAHPDTAEVVPDPEPSESPVIEPVPE